MDEKGRKVIVCDNGTGVSRYQNMFSIGRFDKRLNHHYPHDLLSVLVREVWICGQQLPSFHIPVDGRPADHQG